MTMSENNASTSNTAAGAPAESTADTATAAANSAQQEPNDNLETKYGDTIIDDVVVSKIAGIAAREVSGVYALGGGGARMMGSIRESFGGSEDVRQGVSVEVDKATASIEVAIIAEYGVAIHELAEAIRRNIMNSIERMTGLRVTRVDVMVHDVKLPKEEADENQTQSTLPATQE